MYKADMIPEAPVIKLALTQRRRSGRGDDRSKNIAGQTVLESEAADQPTINAQRSLPNGG